MGLLSRQRFKVSIVRARAKGKPLKINGPIWALGAMSGTSLDGVDAAMLRTDGERIEAFGETGYRAYSDADRSVLRGALGAWQGADSVEPAAEIVETRHASLLSGFEGAELVGFHGQTLAHDPAGGRTHQCGDGALLAEVLGVPVVWDFRSADVALGGQGAPLAPFFHHACARYLGKTAPVAFLNLGGVGNISFVDPSIAEPQEPGAVLAFDTGPANAPINDLVQRRLKLAYDLDGTLGLAGTVSPAVVEAFLNAPYFFKTPPKSLDRDDFSDLAARVADLSDPDAVASLGACVSASVARAMEHAPALPSEVLVTGGGRKNPHIMKCLRSDLKVDVIDIDEVGLNGDMLEAQAFAYLAVRVARGLPTSCSSTTGVSANVGGGVVSKPSLSAS